MSHQKAKRAQLGKRSLTGASQEQEQPFRLLELVQWVQVYGAQTTLCHSQLLNIFLSWEEAVSMKQSERIVYCWGKLPKSLVAEFLVLCSFSFSSHYIKCGGVHYKHRIAHAFPHLLYGSVSSSSFPLPLYQIHFMHLMCAWVTMHMPLWGIFVKNELPV